MFVLMIQVGKRFFSVIMIAHIFFFLFTFFVLSLFFFFFFGFIFLFPGRPVEVLIEFKLMSFGKIREEDMVSCLSLANMGMRQKWAR